MTRNLTKPQFEAELASGAYAWPGGYPRRFIMADGESCCFKCAESEKARILEEIDSGFDRDWIPAACEILWEGEPESCAHCSAEIESAYGAPDSEEPAAEPLEPAAEPLPAERPLVEHLARHLDAMGRCAAGWRDYHESAIEWLCKEHLPSGSGFDSGSTLSLDDSRPDRLCFQTSFHHMNDGGFYDGWTEHRVIASPSFVLGFDLKVTGRDKRGIKDYIAETFSQALGQSVPDYRLDD